MRQRTASLLVLALLTLLVVLLVTNPPTVLLDPGEYETTTVSVHDDNGTKLATVDVKLADTPEKRQIGLRRTDSLDEDEGMLFVHPESDTHTYHMRGVSFPLDIVFVADNGTITNIHHASASLRSYFDRYRGEGKYVLEVERDWTTTRNIQQGDVLHIPDNVTEGAKNGTNVP